MKSKSLLCPQRRVALAARISDLGAPALLESEPWRGMLFWDSIAALCCVSLRAVSGLLSSFARLTGLTGLTGLTEFWEGVRVGP